MYNTIHSHTGSYQHILLRRKVKVESILKSVEVKLTRREEPSGGLGGGKVERSGRLLGSKSGLLGSSGLLADTGKKTSLMAGIKGVDKGVDTGTVSAVRYTSQLVGHRGLGVELGSVHVELEVSVGGIVGVDEGVEVGVSGSVNVVIVGDSLDGLLLLGLDKAGSSGGGDSSLDLLLGSRDFRVKGSRV
jgi:hypothetical protein